MTIPRNDEFNAPRLSNYGYAQAEPTIATLEHQRIDHHRQNVSPQMIHFQQIEERMVDQLNELYKATMMIRDQRDTGPPQRLPEHDEVDRINQTYLQQNEPIYNAGECRISRIFPDFFFEVNIFFNFFMKFYDFSEHFQQFSSNLKNLKSVIQKKFFGKNRFESKSMNNFF